MNKIARSYNTSMRIIGEELEQTYREESRLANDMRIALTGAREKLLDEKDPVVADEIATAAMQGDIKTIREYVG